MKIKTNFNIGDIFWMPRVRYKTIVDTKLLFGFEYYRNIDILTPFVKQKRISHIDINVSDDGIKIEYSCREILDENDTPIFDYNMSLITSEKDFKFKTKEEAMAFAENWALTEKTEYFGEKD